MIDTIGRNIVHNSAPDFTMIKDVLNVIEIIALFHWTYRFNASDYESVPANFLIRPQIYSQKS